MSLIPCPKISPQKYLIATLTITPPGPSFTGCGVTKRTLLQSSGQLEAAINVVRKNMARMNTQRTNESTLR